MSGWLGAVWRGWRGIWVRASLTGPCIVRAPTLMRTGLGVAVLTIALIASGCGSGQPSAAPTATTPGATTQPTTQSTGQPTSGEPTPTQPTAEPGQTSQPTAEPGPTGTPGPTSEPEAEAVPLQAPELESPEEIAQALFQPELAEQAVVSMLDELGIGIYQLDGTPIRAGTESSDSDFFIAEPEVRGLIDMLEQQDDFETWITFRDFHAALAGLGLQASAEDLAQAYADSYAANPEAPITQFVNALAVIDGDAQINRFTAWLLILDGFVPPHANAVAIAAVGGWFGATPRPGGRGWGVASNQVQALAGVPLTADPQIIAHLMAVVAQSTLKVTALPSKAHEGHGGDGSPVTITAQLTVNAWAFTSPFSGLSVVPLNTGSAAGLPVTWTTDAALNAHGSASSLSGTTDPLARAQLTFTPKKEKANGQGYIVTETSIVQAAIPASQVITQAYGYPALGALVAGEVRGIGNLLIEWHEPEAMHIELINEYDVTIKTFVGDIHGTGVDMFTGTLVLQEDGTWRGNVVGKANGSQTGQAFGRACSSSWSTTQLMEVVGQAAPNATGGDFVFLFYPIAAPRGSMGSGRCPPTRRKTSYGATYAPYNDYAISQAEASQGLVIILPNKPGATGNYPVADPPGPDITIKNTSWQVLIQYLEP